MVIADGNGKESNISTWVSIRKIEHMTEDTAAQCPGQGTDESLQKRKNTIYKEEEETMQWNYVFNLDLTQTYQISFFLQASAKTLLIMNQSSYRTA